jgi:hypothetical protein
MGQQAQQLAQQMRSLLLLFAVGLCACGESGPSTGTPPTAASVATDNSAVAVYKTVVQRDMPDLETAVSKATCGDLPSCRVEMGAVKAAAVRFQTELVLAPDCLKAADLPLTLALEELITGTGEVITGIDNSDSTLMDVGVADFKSASAHLTTFNEKYAAASC